MMLMASKVEASLFWFSKLLLLPRLQLPLPRCKACCISRWKKKLHLVKCLALRCYAFYIDAFDQNPFEASVAKKMPLLCYFNFNPKFNPFSYTTEIAHEYLHQTKSHKIYLSFVWILASKSDFRIWKGNLGWLWMWFRKNALPRNIGECETYQYIQSLLWVHDTPLQ